MDKKTKEQNDDVVDVMESTETTTAVVTTEPGGAIATTTTTVQGVSLRFPFVRVGQAMSQWRVNGRPPSLGDLYIGKDKTTNTLIGEAGVDKGFQAILLDVVPGILEDKPFTGTANPPKRWVGPTAEQDAEKDGFSLKPVPTGEVWADSGRPKMRANASRFCYLQMLVPATDEMSSADYQLFPIGDKLYTPARIEFSKGAFKGLSEIIGNVERVERFHHRNEKDYQFSWRGKIVHIYTAEAISKQTGATYPLLKFGLAVNGGKTIDLTKEEKDDFTAFLMSITSTTVESTETTGDDW